MCKAFKTFSECFGFIALCELKSITELKLSEPDGTRDCP